MVEGNITVSWKQQWWRETSQRLGNNNDEGKQQWWREWSLGQEMGTTSVEVDTGS